MKQNKMSRKNKSYMNNIHTSLGQPLWNPCVEHQRSFSGTCCLLCRNKTKPYSAALQQLGFRARAYTF